jgi:hypothetical protein
MHNLVGLVDNEIKSLREDILKLGIYSKFLEAVLDGIDKATIGILLVTLRNFDKEWLKVGLKTRFQRSDRMLYTTASALNYLIAYSKMSQKFFQKRPELLKDGKQRIRLPLFEGNAAFDKLS